MTLTHEQVPWGAASMLLRRHGEHAPARVAERIGELALAGDEEGVAMWREIARCVEQLTRAKNTH